MSKGLEALKDFREHYFFERDEEENLNAIEEELKALEIIKEIDKTSLLHFIAVTVKDQNKYNLLKEVLL